MSQFFGHIFCRILLGGISAHYSAARGGKYEYEIVIVPKMVPNWADDEDAFRDFLSGFPSSCLAIPFQDTNTHDNVCANLDFNTFPVGLFVNNNQKVVYHKPFFENGFELWPFICLLCPGVHNPWEKPLTHLDSFLDSDFVYKIDSNSNSTSNNFDDIWGDKVSVSELKDKLVGVYLCYDGTFIRTLDLISRECQARNQEFQIVMVFFPYCESVNPRLFMEVINHVLRNLNIIFTNSNWWVSPFNDSLSRRILEFYEFFLEDKLIILEPHKNRPNPYRKCVVDLYGIDGYPFTTEARVNKELEAIRATTLESLLVYGSRDYVLRMNFNNDVCDAEKVPVAELHVKVILLYVGSRCSRKYYDFLDWYYWNKTNVLFNFYVVFVGVDEKFHSSMWTPWLVCPYDPQHATFVEEKILKGKADMLIAFSKDGQIITLHVLDLFESYGPKGFPSFEWYFGLRNKVIGDIDVPEEIYLFDLAD